MEPSPYRPPQNLYSENPTRAGNLGLAIAAGLAAALVGAALWAMIAAFAHVKIGFAAVGVGYLVGIAVRKAGQGREPIYGYVGAGLALLGCVVGDLLSDCIGLANGLNEPLTNVFAMLTPSLAMKLLEAGFGVLDILFYVLAAMAGYRNAFFKG